MILELNTDNQAKELLEGQRRYREMMATQYSAGYIDAEENYKSIIADKDATIADMSAEITDKNATIADKDAALADKDATIADMGAEIAALKKALEDLKNSH